MVDVVYTYKSLLNYGKDLLRTNYIENYQLDSRILLQNASDISHEELITKYYDKVSKKTCIKYLELLEKRIKNFPIAYITGNKEFYGRIFKVNQATLIPRPETELIIDAALAIFNINQKLNILDLGTGSGCLAITLLLEFNQASSIAVDISDKALSVAKINSIDLSVNNRINFILSNWLDCLEEEKFDLIVSNPPYVPKSATAYLAQDIIKYEPHLALFSGEDGLDSYRLIIPKLRNFLTSNGFVILEVGMMQHEHVTEIAQDNQLSIYDIRSDLAGIKRIVILQNND